MSALEIVMVSLCSLMIAGIIVTIIIHIYLNKFKVNRVYDFYEMDEVNHSDIVFLGDSLTDFFPTHELLSKKVLNRGVAGDTTNDVMKRIDEIISINPKVVYLQIGVNDLIYSKKITSVEVKNRIFNIIRFLQEKGIVVRLISLYPINRRRMAFTWVSCKFASNKKIKEVNKLLKEEANDKNIVFIDVYDKLLNEKGVLANEFTVEGLHLSIKGYKTIINDINEYLEKEEVE